MITKISYQTLFDMRNNTFTQRRLSSYLNLEEFNTINTLLDSALYPSLSGLEITDRPNSNSSIRTLDDALDMIKDSISNSYKKEK